MPTSVRRVVLGICAAAALLVFVGCAKREHREIRVTEEQYESEVVEEQPGEMIVE